MPPTRRAFATALSLTGFAALAPLRLIDDALAQGSMAALVAKPRSLPDWRSGRQKLR